MLGWPAEVQGPAATLEAPGGQHRLDQRTRWPTRAGTGCASAWPGSPCGPRWRRPVRTAATSPSALRLLPLSDRDRDVEILALRHQLAVLERQFGGVRPPVRARGPHFPRCLAPSPSQAAPPSASTAGDAGRRTPDAGRRTPDAGRRTPDAGPARPRTRLRHGLPRRRAIWSWTWRAPGAGYGS